ncbi:hypothetical protein Acr_24g0017510 [Actinidia rufa]|uniref:DC1 domain-containing protein n=1 Tax=Actinidia rufa TaxID=165716 RepID=A0A7J0GXR4_9ERIC|nr:hypothetical protein Acr_24g0017510 [Actinidia rufa]
MELAQRPTIVAMKGHPCTGKSTLALMLAPILQKCVVIDPDDVYDCIRDLCPTEHLMDLSFEAICRIASEQLRSGIFQVVIIDSPLSSKAHLERLRQISTDVGTLLLIIECKPQDQYEWQRRLEQRGGSSEPEDLERLQEWYNGCGDYDTGDDVSKLVVDTTKVFTNYNLDTAVRMLRSYQGTYTVDFNTWMEEFYPPLENDYRKETPKIERETERERMERIFGGPFIHIPHRLTLSTSNIATSASCRGCLKRIISGPFYSCALCDLSIHKLCAELPDKKQLEPNQTPPFVDPSSHEYCFPATHECKIHADANLGFVADCYDCAFNTHLRSALVPTAVLHECHQHPLFFTILSTLNKHGNTLFECHACGDLGGSAYYSCIECKLKVDVNCALLPPTRKDRHHRHILTLTASPPSGDNSDIEIYCNSCEKSRNPKHWIYYCAECDFASHLYCDRVTSTG